MTKFYKKKDFYKNIIIGVLLGLLLLTVLINLWLIDTLEQIPSLSILISFAATHIARVVFGEFREFLKQRKKDKECEKKESS